MIVSELSDMTATLTYLTELTEFSNTTCQEQSRIHTHLAHLIIWTNYAKLCVSLLVEALKLAQHWVHYQGNWHIKEGRMPTLASHKSSFDPPPRAALAATLPSVWSMNTLSWFVTCSSFQVLLSYRIMDVYGVLASSFGWASYEFGQWHR